MSKPCQVRSVTPDDLSMLLNWRNHLEVRQFMFTQHEISLDEHLNWFARANQDRSRCLLIVEESDEPIGYVQFNHVSMAGVSDWGFYVRPHAPPGSGTKLGQAALQHAFEKLQLHKVCGQAIETNQASIRFHQKLGFTHEGTLREQQRVDNTYRSVICFGLLAHEWSSRSKTEESTNVSH